MIEVLQFSWFAVVLLSAVGETLMKEAQRWRLLHNECDLSWEAVLMEDLSKRKTRSSPNTQKMPTLGSLLQRSVVPPTVPC